MVTEWSCGGRQTLAAGRWSPGALDAERLGDPGTPRRAPPAGTPPSPAIARAVADSPSRTPRAVVAVWSWKSRVAKREMSRRRRRCAR